MRSVEELRDVSGYASRSLDDFADLLRMLDRELRLITPVDPGGSVDEDLPSPAPGGRYFQLTHDYLVHALRDWLTRMQRETLRGRAELRLAERAALWESRPENRRLPSVFEWARIRALTHRKDWTDPQRRMMRRAGRVHGLRAIGLAILIALGTWGGVDAYRHLHSADLVASLETADTSDVPRIIARMEPYRRWVNPLLVRMISETEPSGRAHLHARLALPPADPTQDDPLYDRLIAAAPADLRVLLDRLENHKAMLIPRLWPALEKAEPGDPSLLAAASALARYDPEDGRWSDLCTKVAGALVSLNPILLGAWLDALRPVRGKLTAPLEAIFRDKDRLDAAHDQAAIILTDYAADEPERLAHLMIVSDANSFVRLFPAVAQQAVRGKAIAVFRAELAENQATREKEVDTEQARDERAERQARAAIALVRLGHADEVWRLLQHSPDPRLRSFIINWLQPLGADPQTVASELAPPDSRSTRHPAPFPPKMDAILFHPETSTRRALILALGTYGFEGLSPGDGKALISLLLDLYENDPDAGIHGAAEWALRRWKQLERVTEIDKRLRGQNRGDRRWEVNGQGQTIVFVEGPVQFRMGSPTDEPGRLLTDLKAHPREIDHRFAIAAKEVSVADYQKFVKFAGGGQEFGFTPEYVEEHSPQLDGPMIGVNWYEAAAYCNWLNKEEGISEDQWCYLPGEKDRYAKGMKIKADALKLTGYRLPTEAEWEYACRAGARTSRYYGSTIGLLEKYACYQKNSGEHAWTCGSLIPNDLGLFDMLGNVYEWCQERCKYDPFAKSAVVSGESIEEDTRWLRGGTFEYTPKSVRSAARQGNLPSSSNTFNGFRVVRSYR
jgi:formylglycine-generating enzyme required for sulfatase activity